MLQRTLRWWAFIWKDIVEIIPVPIKTVYLAIGCWCFIVAIGLVGMVYFHQQYSALYQEWLVVKGDYEEKRILVNSKEAKTIKYFKSRQESAHSMTSHVMMIIKKYPIVVVGTRDLPMDNRTEHITTHQFHSAMEIELIGELMDILQCIDELNAQIIS